MKLSCPSQLPPTSLQSKVKTILMVSFSVIQWYPLGRATSHHKTSIFSRFKLWITPQTDWRVLARCKNRKAWPDAPLSQCQTSICRLRTRILKISHSTMTREWHTLASPPPSSIKFMTSRPCRGGRPSSLESTLYRRLLKAQIKTINSWKNSTSKLNSMLDRSINRWWGVSSVGSHILSSLTLSLWLNLAKIRALKIRLKMT